MLFVNSWSFLLSDSCASCFLCAALHTHMFLWDLLAPQVSGLEKSPSESRGELCGPSASPSTQCLCQSFSNASYPHCTQEGLISCNEQFQGKFSAEGSSWLLLFPLGFSLLLFQQGKGGAVPWLGLSACSFPFLWWKNVNLVSEATSVLPSPLQAWVRGQHRLSHLLQLGGNGLQSERQK